MKTIGGSRARRLASRSRRSSASISRTISTGVSADCSVLPGDGSLSWGIATSTNENFANENSASGKCFSEGLDDSGFV